MRIYILDKILDDGVISMRRETENIPKYNPYLAFIYKDVGTILNRYA